ncbi:MAG: ABC transporter [Verrucomicrobia bacterium]|nr:ABC transporter [Verrucomicrobiota bacterium]
MQTARLNEFRIARRMRAINRLVQIFLGLCLIITLNYLASRHFQRFDLTQNRQFSLSAESQAYLQQLETPIDIIVTIASGSDVPELKRIRNDLDKLLLEYEVTSMREGQAFVRVEFVDALRPRNRTRELVQTYNIERDNVIIVAANERTRLIELPELYEAEEGQWHSFCGERILTSAILEVSNEESPVLYHLTGHGEMRIGDVHPTRGLSLLEGFLQERGFTLRELDLTRVAAVPEDAAMILALAPQAALAPAEVEKLRRYMSARNGRMILALEPGRKHGLNNLLFDWGILVEDYITVDVDPNYRSQEGDMIVRHFSEHPISKILYDYNATAYFGQSRPIRIDPASQADESLSLRYLIGTSQKSWAEKDYRTQRPLAFDADRDLPGPLSLGVAAQRSTSSALGLSISGGRFVCFGNSDFLANNRFQIYGNYTLLINSLNWALDRNVLLNIPAQPLSTYQLIMSQDDLRRLLTYFALLPITFAALGIIISLIRRR